MNYSHSTFASTYGSSNYGTSTYDCGANCGTEASTPLAPLTGFFAEQPSIVLAPTLLGIAVVIGSVTYMLSRKFKTKKL